MSNRRTFISVVIIPTLLVQTGLTMVSTFVPIYARDLGSSMAGAAVISAMLFLGQALADLPGGILVHRFGDKPVMLAGIALTAVSAAVRLAFETLTVLTVSMILFGVGISFIWIARMAWMKRGIRGAERGFAMSFVGGSLRVALILGPLAGGFLAERYGFAPLFVIQGILGLIAMATVAAAMPPSVPEGGDYRRSLSAAAARWNEQRGTVLSAAVGIGGLTVLRASRGILFPLWADELGLAESRVGLVMFVGSVVDVSLFWLSGVIMTRSGRKAAAIACTASLAAAIALLPLADGMGTLAILSALAGIGNAMGAGINLTVSGDLAPRESPEAFLSIWRFLMGFAGFGGPALAAWAIGLVGTGAAPPMTAAAGFTGALAMVLFMKETHGKIEG